MTDATGAVDVQTIAPADLQAIARAKSPFRSLTFWGIQLGLVGGWAATSVAVIDTPTVQTAIGAAAALLIAEGALLAGVGRARATSGLQ